MSRAAAPAARADALRAEPWEKARTRTLRIAELFASIQGEGTRAGLPTSFVRLVGCALRCRWCDTEWAFEGGERRTLASVAGEVAGHGLPRVCVTGGEPLLQPSVVPLVRHLHEDLGLDVAVETGGDQDVSVLPPGVTRIMDVKLPGSGMEGSLREENLAALGARDEIKLVVADRTDYETARAWIRGPLSGFAGALLVAPVHGELEPAELAGWMLEDRLPARLQLQLHKLVWPGRDRGV